MTEAIAVIAVTINFELIIFLIETNKKNKIG
ncbi:hypothetical protein P872_07310 [Rhodonellum psychrophilum GCM71 = DSM 17998]|uniref:Uncharacterized protein n=2 Tax=Rhodonellum TaxID=336827 RepID=U5C1Z7_9BACT|nr:hypothetical protein P872_07310 [Rhodonellum psychrophilum GCM71 = DSM 17998]SDZ40971.1 hypothetical protein SAMN05444412_11381 [Rhodonellum ikkaensis]